MANTLKFGNGQWATKVGSTLAYNDEGGNFKPLPFNFTRSTSGTRVNKDGLIEVVTNNKPRIDYLNNSNGALLLEPSRTNLITYSEDFTQSVWSDLRVSLTSNNAISPDGTLNASELTLDATNDSHTLIHSTMTGLSANANHTISVFVKSNGNDKVALRDASVGNYISVDLSNGVILDENNINSSIENFGNDWFRISITFLSSSSGQIRPSLYLLEDSYSSGSPSSAYLGDGVSSVYVWGFQAEANSSYATSYIPTQGAISTRVAETCSNAGNSQIFNDSEGVLFAEVSTFADNTYKRISLNNGSYVNSVVFDFIDDNNLYGKIFVGGSQIATILASGLNIENNNKLAFKYKQNDFALWVNGVQVGVDTSGLTPSGLNTLGLDLAGNQDFYGNIKQIQYFDTALTDSELQALTTI